MAPVKVDVPDPTFVRNASTPASFTLTVPLSTSKKEEAVIVPEPLTVEPLRNAAEYTLWLVTPMLSVPVPSTRRRADALPNLPEPDRVSVPAETVVAYP